MKPTDFSKHLTDFLTLYLPGERGVSYNTVCAYKDTFLLFLQFMKEMNAVDADKLTLEQITRKKIIAFLDWIQKERNNSISTRNARLAAIHSFFRYLQYRNPVNLHEWQQILSIPAKKAGKPSMNYISLEGIKLLLQQPDQTIPKGKRDLALLSLMYDSGARVQEIIDLIPASINLNKPYTINLWGKGNKGRTVPLMDSQIQLLRNYMEHNGLLEAYASKYPLFYNSRREKLSRMGITVILKKYADKARSINQELMPDVVTPHTIRHSKAMHLLQSGVNLVYIRDFLGHTSISTTEIYARADSKLKREALEKAYSSTIPKSDEEVPMWKKDMDLLEWLKGFK
ncbi:MAG: site-specific integrase [Prevotella sp.]|jgi:site-specific recombinase XerD|nr:site-specific integrase [Prevotella sp.]